MDFADEKFNVVIPASLEKSEDGEWRVYGRASTSKRDLQGEVVDLKGLDLTPIEHGRGIFNFDHKKGPENTVGVIDQYKKTDDGLYLGGYLFKEHDRAKALRQIMTSLKKSDRGRMGMSIEGVIKQREGKDGKVIKNAVITSCALTMNPVNEDTFVNLVKSLSGVEFDGNSLADDFIPEATPSTVPSTPPATLFTVDQVVSLLSKALGAGAAYATSTPQNLSGGDALAQESLAPKKAKVDSEPEEESEESEIKPKKKLKIIDAKLAKSNMGEILDQLQKLHPDCSRSELWEAVKNRLNKRFLDRENDSEN